MIIFMGKGLKMMLLAVMLLVTGTSMAQNRVITEEVGRADLNKSQMYQAAKDWYHRVYNHSIEDIIIEENEDKGKMLYKLWNRHSFAYNGAGDIVCTIEILAKDGKVKFTIQDITHEFDDKSRPSLFSIKEKYDMNDASKKNEKKAIEDVLPEIEGLCDNMKQSFVKHIMNYRP